MASAQVKAAVICSAVSVRRGGRLALDDVSTSIRAGSITGLLGPSGSGKSTLIRSIVGTQRNVKGTVTVLGEPAGSADLRSRVGYVTQSSSVYTDLTVHQNLTYFARLAGADESVIGKCLDTLDIGDLTKRHCGTLSGGQLRRVSIGCALVGSPDLLVLDEPTVGLDPVLRVDLWARFAALAKSGVTLLVSSHVMEDASHCEELIMLREGRLLATTTPQELLAQTGTHSMDDAFLALIENSEQRAR